MNGRRRSRQAAHRRSGVRLTDPGQKGSPMIRTFALVGDGVQADLPRFFLPARACGRKPRGGLASAYLPGDPRPTPAVLRDGRPSAGAVFSFGWRIRLALREAALAGGLVGCLPSGPKRRTNGGKREARSRSPQFEVVNVPELVGERWPRYPGRVQRAGRATSAEVRSGGTGHRALFWRKARCSPQQPSCGVKMRYAALVQRFSWHSLAGWIRANSPRNLAELTPPRHRIEQFHRKL